MKDASFAWFRLDLDRSFMTAHDAIANRQAQTGPLAYRLCRKKRIEDLVEIARRNAHTRVLKLNPHKTLAILDFAGSANGKGSGLIHGIHGIDGQGEKNLTKFTAVPDDRWTRRIQF